jgi:peptidoglycan/LPS O-acetylase OafA/YrhL
MKTLLTLVSAAESAVGLALLAIPSWVASLLLGSTLDTPIATTVARVAGFALLALGIACWQARLETPSRATRGIVSAMLLYNAGVCALLVYASLATELSGVGLWPTAILHAGLAAWCAAALAPPGNRS